MTLFGFLVGTQGDTSGSEPYVSSALAVHAEYCSRRANCPTRPVSEYADGDEEEDR